MQDRAHPPSLGHRVLRLSITWLLIGAVIGVVNGRGTGAGTGIEIVSMMIGGMIALMIPGIVLGVIGGDARGSFIGAAGGLLGDWLAQVGGGVALQPPVIVVSVIFSSLVGATVFLFIRFLFWKYRMVLKSICWLIDATPLSDTVASLAAYRPKTRAFARNSGAPKIPFRSTRAEQLSTPADSYSADPNPRRNCWNAGSSRRESVSGR